SGGFACYAVYPTADNRAITVACVEPQFWKNLCERLDRPDLIALQYAPEPAQSRVFDALGSIFARRARDAWIDFFGDDEVCIAPALSLGEALAVHRDRLVEIEQPGEGTVRHLGGLFGSTSTLPAPSLGEHTDETLAALGRSHDETAALRASRII